MQSHQSYKHTEALWPVPVYWVITDSGDGLVPEGTKPSPEPVVTYHQPNPTEQTWMKYNKIQAFSFKQFEKVFYNMLPSLF